MSKDNKVHSSERIKITFTVVITLKKHVHLLSRQKKLWKIEYIPQIQTPPCHGLYSLVGHPMKGILDGAAKLWFNKYFCVTFKKFYKTQHYI